VSAAFTVILPHLRNPGNDAALAICLDCLIQNTVNEFVLLMDTRTDLSLAGIVSALVEYAPTECCVYLASDTFLAPGWDAPMLALYAADTFVNGVLIEPGAIGVYPENFQRDFGRRPNTFDRAAFEAYCINAEVPDGTGWFCPYMFPRTGWLDAGGLTTLQPTDHHGFTTADIELFDRWKAAGNRVVRARSYAYHLQRYSQEDEQLHEKRG
jgi:hypothetical protein